MNIEDAFELINMEFESDDGLDLLFRMSADIEVERLEKFLKALALLQEHYTGRDLMEKDIAYKLFSFYTTLNASAGHWKVSRPEGLTVKTVSAIYIAISGIFSTD